MMVEQAALPQRFDHRLRAWCRAARTSSASASMKGASLRACSTTAASGRVEIGVSANEADFAHAGDLHDGARTGRREPDHTINARDWSGASRPSTRPGFAATGRRPPARSFGLLGRTRGLQQLEPATRPNTASSATVVPGDVPTLGDGSGGGISVTGASIMRTGTKLTVTAQIHNGQSTADELRAGRQQREPDADPAAAAEDPRGRHRDDRRRERSVVLDQTGRLEPGGTVALCVEFGDAGAVAGVLELP